MDAILVKLLLLRLRGGVRLRLHELKTLRGLLFLLVMIATITLLMNQSALPANSLGSFLPSDPEQLRGQATQFMPIALLAAFLLTVFTSSGPAIYFSPSEINLLFSGPFTRPALLLYKMCFYAFGALLSSLLIMLLIPSFTYTPLAAFLGTFLTLLFLQLFSAATGLLGQLLEKYFNTVLKRSYILIIVIVPVAVIAWYFANISNSLIDTLALFQSSTIGTLVLAPFEVYVHIFLAKSIFPDLLGWATLGLAMNLGLLAIIILLDSHSSEASIAASLKLHKRWARTRRSGLFWSAQPSVVRPVMHHPPMLRGIGPIAWHQLLTALRSSRKVLLVFLGLAMLAGPLLVIASADISIWSLIGGVFFAAVFVLPRTLVFDFRSNLDIMENFKALPLSPFKISIGQLLSPVLLTSVIELVLLGSTAILLDETPRTILIGIIPFLLPFNMLLYGLENLFFLLFPAPLVPVGRADFDFLGRTMVGFAVTATLLIGSCFLAASAGQMALNIIGSSSWLTFMGIAWLSLTLIAFTVLPLLSWAFNRFDVSRY